MQKDGAPCASLGLWWEYWLQVGWPLFPAEVGLFLTPPLALSCRRWHQSRESRTSHGTSRSVSARGTRHQWAYPHRPGGLALWGSAVSPSKAGSATGVLGQRRRALSSRISGTQGSFQSPASGAMASGFSIPACFLPSCILLLASCSLPFVIPGSVFSWRRKVLTLHY